MNRDIGVGEDVYLFLAAYTAVNLGLNPASISLYFLAAYTAVN
ncbi:putative membrane protein [Pseudomonas aeruginosa]|nr:putative membrane protein [Pseudomonas aeruginosa]